MIKKIVIILILAAIGFGVWTIFKNAKAEEDAKLASTKRTTTVIVTDIQTSVETTATIQPVISTEIKSEINGKIATIFIKDGDAVKKGDKLIELDTVSLQADKTEALRSFQSRELALEKAKRDFERMTKLDKDGFVQKKDLMDAETSYKSAEIDVQLAQTRLDKAEENLSKTLIVAPHDGIITDMKLTEGQVIVGASSVNNGMILMKIHDLSQLQAESNVNELDVKKISVGMKTILSFDSVPEAKIQGTISRIAPFAQKIDNVSSFPIVVSFSRGEYPIKPGISANLSIPIETAENAVAVVVSALFIENKERFVYVSNSDGSTEKRPVKTGLSNTRYVAITEGLKEGEEVLITRPSTNGRR